jgi:hypothetical protein
VRAHLGDRGVYLALLRRLSLDIASALLVGLLCSNASHALWLGAAAALLSASLAATPYLHRAELVLHDGVWWQHRNNGDLTRLRVVPKSLRLWASYLSEQEAGKQAWALATLDESNRPREPRFTSTHPSKAP